MRVFHKNWAVCLGLSALAVVPANASLTYEARVDQAEWRLEQSAMECRLSQPIPNFGQASFIKRAGEVVQFQLATYDKPVVEGVAIVTALVPEWRVNAEPLMLGEVAVRRSSPTIAMHSEAAARLLVELQRGLSPTFANVFWYDESNPISVGVSAVNFQAAFTDYQSCLASMVPVDFNQVERTRVEFAFASTYLTEGMKEQLQLVARYVLADPDIRSCFVDGHTDDKGDGRFNLNLSKRRAEVVSKHLQSLGVSEKALTIRYHGERFPVTANSDEAGRMKNRRVTIRLARG